MMNREEESREQRGERRRKNWVIMVLGSLNFLSCQRQNILCWARGEREQRAESREERGERREERGEWRMQP